MKWLLALAMILSAAMAQAKPKARDLRDADDWSSFQTAMEEARLEDRKTGWSYLASGALVTIGGFVGASSAEDSTSKFIYGLSEGLGVAGMAYGVAKLSYGNPYNSFYESLRDTSLTPEQRDSLVRIYMEREREKRESIRKINLATHTIIGLMNLYSASKENDANAKTFFQVFAGINFALAVSYTF